MTKEFLGAAATILGIAGYLPYFWGLYRGTIRPHVFSWFLWGALMVIIYAIQVSEKAGPGAWMTGVSAVFCLLSLPLWYLTENPVYAIILLTAIEALAFYPTMRKAWNKPWHESGSTFAVMAVKFALSLFAIENMGFTTAFYPAAVVGINLALAILILWRRFVLGWNGPAAALNVTKNKNIP